MINLKHISLLFLFITLYTPNFAQKIKVDWSEKKQVNGSVTLAGTTNDFYYHVVKQKDKIEIQQFDLEHNHIQTIPLNFKLNKKAFTTKIINTASNSFLLLFIDGERSRKEIRKVVYSSPILNEKGTLKINNFKMLFKFNVGLKKIRDAYGVKISSDSSKVLFTQMLSNKKKRVKGDYLIHVFDSNLDTLWNHKLQFFEREKNLWINQFDIDNSGNVFLSSLKRKEEKIKSYLPKNHIIIYKIQSEGLVKKEIIQLNEEIPNDLILHIHPDGNIYTFGFYTEKEKKPKSNFEHGLFMIKFDSELKKISDQVSILDSEFYDWIKAKYRIYRPRNTTNSNYNFRIRKIHFNKKASSFILISEFSYTTSTPNNNKSWSSSTIRKDLVLFSFDFNGLNQWIKIVEKNSGSSNVHTFNSALKNGNLFLVFADSKTISERKRLDKQEGRWSTTVDLAILNSDGELKYRDILFTEKQSEFQFFPRRTKLINNDKFLFKFSGVTILKKHYVKVATLLLTSFEN